jgi:hypothetical protein
VVRGLADDLNVANNCILHLWILPEGRGSERPIGQKLDIVFLLPTNISIFAA